MAAPQPRWPIGPLITAAATVAATVAGRPLHQPEGCGACDSNPTAGRGCYTLVALAHDIGTTDRTIHRWITAGGIPDRSADTAAVALGLVPELIWPTYATGSAAA